MMKSSSLRDISFISLSMTLPFMESVLFVTYIRDLSFMFGSKDVLGFLLTVNLFESIEKSNILMIPGSTSL